MDSTVSFAAKSIASSVSFRHKAFESSQWFDGGDDDDEDDELFTFIRCIGKRRTHGVLLKGTAQSRTGGGGLSRRCCGSNVGLHEGAELDRDANVRLSVPLLAQQVMVRAMVAVLRLARQTQGNHAHARRKHGPGASAGHQADAEEAALARARVQASS